MSGGSPLLPIGEPPQPARRVLEYTERARNLWGKQRLDTIPICIRHQGNVRIVRIVGAPGNNKIRRVALDSDQSADRACSEVLGVVEDLHAPIGDSSSASV